MFPLSSLSVLGAAERAGRLHGAAVRRLLLRSPRQLGGSGLGGGLLYRGRRVFFAAGEESAGGYGGHIRGLQESGAHSGGGAGGRGGPESARTGEPGL